MTNLHIRTVDLPTFVNQVIRQSVGFDQLFNQLNYTINNTGADNKYPPHNVIQRDETHYAIELAVAGFEENEINIELSKNVLTITGEQVPTETEVTYFHKGISTRDFVKTFPLGDNIEVINATVRNGILTIALERIIPEQDKPKTIAITYES